VFSQIIGQYRRPRQNQQRQYPVQPPRVQRRREDTHLEATRQGKTLVLAISNYSDQGRYKSIFTSFSLPRGHASVGHLYRTRRSAILPRPSQTRGQVKITLAARIITTYQQNNMQHLPRIYRLANRPDPTYEAWVTNSWCISSVYFEHREDLSIECRACYLNLLPCDQELYRGVSRHYLNFGSLDRVEECATCNTRIGVARPLNSCEICPLIQAQFLTYLHEEGESPWEDPEPTIVGINTIRL